MSDNLTTEDIRDMVAYVHTYRGFDDWYDRERERLWEECVEAHKFARGTTLPANPYTRRDNAY